MTPKPESAIPPPARKSAWSTREKLYRLFWGTLGRALWTFMPGSRIWILRLFGCKVGPGCRISRSARIYIPWHVTIGRNVEIGDRAIIYSLGPIIIGDDCVLDREAHLCAGTHDMTDSRFPLLRPPITIGDGCYIGLDAYVGPDVVLGDNCIVWPRACVYRSFDSGLELKGNPARPVEQPAGKEPVR